MTGRWLTLVSRIYNIFRSVNKLPEKYQLSTQHILMIRSAFSKLHLLHFIIEILRKDEKFQGFEMQNGRYN